jgi:hypothetical protein
MPEEKKADPCQKQASLTPDDLLKKSGIRDNQRRNEADKGA